MKIDIRNCYSGKVLFSHDIQENTKKLTTQAAVNIGVNLAKADLQRTNMAAANLSRAYLSRADLSGANLSGANLYETDLSKADLSGANMYAAWLYGTNLYEADLSRTNLSEANLTGINLFGVNLSGANLRRIHLTRVYFKKRENIVSEIKQFGNFGCRGGYTVAFRLEKSIEINCGCFWGNIEQFTEKVKTTHVGNKYEKEYMAVINLLKEIWGV